MTCCILFNLLNCRAFVPLPEQSLGIDIGIDIRDRSMNDISRHYISVKNVFLQGPTDNTKVPDPVDLVSKLYKQ